MILKQECVQRMADAYNSLMKVGEYQPHCYPVIHMHPDTVAKYRSWVEDSGIEVRDDKVYFKYSEIEPNPFLDKDKAYIMNRKGIAEAVFLEFI